ncbi:MAG: hypothetical protein JXR19_09880 [Bacteroidia bacterium]
MNSKKVLLFLILSISIVPSTFAYLDPGSGSYIVQMIIAGILGGFYALKLYWVRIMNFFKGAPQADPDEELNNE